MRTKDEKKLKEAYSISIRQNPYSVLVLLFLLICGLAAGSATLDLLLPALGEGYLPEFINASYHQSMFSFRSALQLFLLNLSLFLMTVLSGLWIPGILFSTIGFLLKMFITGVAVSALISEFGFAGALTSLLAIVFPGALTLLSICSMAQKSIQEWLIRTRVFCAGMRPSFSPTYLQSILLGLKGLFLGLFVELLLSALGLHLCYTIFDAFAAR